MWAVNDLKHSIILTKFDHVSCKRLKTLHYSDLHVCPVFVYIVTWICTYSMCVYTRISVIRHSLTNSPTCVCTYMYVCTCVLSVLVYKYIHTYAHMYMYIRNYICMYMYIYVQRTPTRTKEMSVKPDSHCTPSVTQRKSWTEFKSIRCIVCGH